MGVNIMVDRDSTTEINRSMWEGLAACGGKYSSAWLELDVDAYRQFAEGKSTELKIPRWDLADGDLTESDRLMMTGAMGKDVLCLASGGGQQSVIFGLLGSRVTVLDFAEGQLELDRKAAEHYGYQVTTVAADMRDLSMFDDDSFDLIEHPVSICFVPEVGPVYAEVARILRPGGLYRVGHVNPATYPCCFEGSDNGWDGKGYRISVPYAGGPIRIHDGAENMTQGEPTGEYRHLLPDIFNEIIKAGLEIRCVWEDARHLHHNPTATPGSTEHRRGYVADYFKILASKR